MRRKKDNRFEYFTDNLVKEFFRTVDNLEDEVLFRVGIECACRQGEIEKIPVPSLDFENNIIVKWDSKKKDWRKCSVSSECMQKVRQYINQQKGSMRLGDNLFSFRGKTADRKIKHWTERLGIKQWVSWHCMRRTFFWQCARKGVPIKIALDNSGDSLSTILKYYQNIALEDKAEIMDEKKILGGR